MIFEFLKDQGGKMDNIVDQMKHDNIQQQTFNKRIQKQLENKQKRDAEKEKDQQSEMYNQIQLIQSQVETRMNSFNQILTTLAKNTPHTTKTLHSRNDNEHGEIEQVMDLFSNHNENIRDISNDINEDSVDTPHEIILKHKANKSTDKNVGGVMTRNQKEEEKKSAESDSNKSATTTQTNV